MLRLCFLDIHSAPCRGLRSAVGGVAAGLGSAGVSDMAWEGTSEVAAAAAPVGWCKGAQGCLMAGAETCRPGKPERQVPTLGVYGKDVGRRQGQG